LGSVLYLVYTRSQQGFEGPNPPASVQPYLLGKGPATDTFLVKWSYWWNI
jgi:hypothetical protein